MRASLHRCIVRPALLLIAGVAGCGGRPLTPGAAGAGQPGFTGAAGVRAATSGTGAAGAGVAGAGGGSAGVDGTGVAGTGAIYTGAAGSTPAPPVPLPIAPSEALQRIAAVLWDQEPPDALVQQAAAGRLATADDLATAVRTMLDDPRASTGVAAFYRWWLGLDDLATVAKDPQLFPELTPELRGDLANETTTFGVQVTLALDETFGTLMTAPFSFMNARIASLYGIAGVTDAPDGSLTRVALPPSQRAGLLTQPSLQALASYANRNAPSHRGTSIERQFFCQTIPSPPTNLPDLALPSGTTVRQALAQSIATQAICSACHVFIDPPGLAFEGFDAIGRARTMDNGGLVDTSNLVLAFPPSSGRDEVVVVNGPVDLAHVMALDPTAQTCMVRQWLAFALGRDLRPEDDPSVARAFARFTAAKLNLKELIVAVLTSDTFLAP